MSRPRTGLGEDAISRIVAKGAMKKMERELSALELRKLALGEAIRINTPGGPTEVVRAAEKYLAFLRGKPTKRGK